MDYPLISLEAPLWRMLTIRFQRDPHSGEGARLLGGRWNPTGVPALYLAADPATAVAEFYQGLAKPGTLAPYRLEASAIADLTNGKGGPVDAVVEHGCTAAWKAMAARGREPPSWTLAGQLIASGAQGAIVPSVQNRGGSCIVLWRWRDGLHDSLTDVAQDGAGQGAEAHATPAASLILLDPEKALSRS